jgi:hypothetical protein
MNEEAHEERPEPRREVKLRTSDVIADLAAALAAAQGEIEMAVKDSENPHFRRTYADLASVWRACRKPLAKNGLAILQVITDRTLITRLTHKSGQWIEGDIRIALDTANGRTEVQAFGSALTYLRRYALSAMVGVAPDDDDDGNGSDEKAAPARGRRSAAPVRRVVEEEEQPYAEEAAKPVEQSEADLTEIMAAYEAASSLDEVRRLRLNFAKVLDASKVKLGREQQAQLRAARARAEERLTKAAVIEGEAVESGSSS